MCILSIVPTFYIVWWSVGNYIIHDDIIFYYEILCEVEDAVSSIWGEGKYLHVGGLETE